LELLTTLAELSHDFGSCQYVRGGGGNTSVKDADTLWIKPSGVTLASVSPSSFVALDRKKLARVYTLQPPADDAEREALVKQVLLSAVRPDSSGRPSVEAPLHNTFKARYVVHTHPALVNGMTCSVSGAKACRRLFPEALWLEYTEPGYTLCMSIREGVKNYLASHGTEPSVVFHENHGLIVAADSPEQVRATSKTVFERLTKEYDKAGISTRLKIGAKPSKDKTASAESLIRRSFRDIEPLFIKSSSLFSLAEGPVSPEHTVYTGAYYLTARPTESAVAEFITCRGYPPSIIAWDKAVFGIGTSEKSAALALELAQDAALIKQLAQAFGGIRYMTDAAAKFIVNWEVEAYRKKQL
jgi:rhamnose utilization protein RhaD (predicted bifunctional aldolase and dehydrogenase)